MTQTRYITGQPSFLKSLIRGLILAGAAIGSIFLLISGAVVAFFILVALVIFGFTAFSFFWAKAKITGKPFGPKAQFERARQDMEAQFKAYQETTEGNGTGGGNGTVIDATETPDGWSVED